MVKTTYVYANCLEPSEKVKAKNLAKKRPNFSKSKNLKILSENKKNYCKKNHFLLKETKNYFACLFFSFVGLADPSWFCFRPNFMI